MGTIVKTPPSALLVIYVNGAGLWPDWLFARDSRYFHMYFPDLDWLNPKNEYQLAFWLVREIQVGCID
jgi:hypothetical protein